MPNPQLTSQIIRLLCNARKPAAAINDLTTGSAVQIIVGSRITFQLMVFQDPAGTFSDASSINDWSNFNSVSVALQDTNNPHNGTTYWSALVKASDILTNVTAANWNNGSAQQISIVLPAGNNIVAISGATRPFWLVIYGTLAADPYDPVPIAAFQVTVLDLGLPPSVGVLYLQGDDGKVHPVTPVRGLQGQLDLAIDQNGVVGFGVSAPFLNYAPDGSVRTFSLITNSLGQKVLTVT